MRTCAGCSVELEEDRVMMCAKCIPKSDKKDETVVGVATSTVASTAVKAKSRKPPTAEQLREYLDHIAVFCSKEKEDCLKFVQILRYELGWESPGVCHNCNRPGSPGDLCFRCNLWFGLASDDTSAASATPTKIIQSSVDYKDVSTVAKHLDAYARLQTELGVTVRGWCIDCIEERPLPLVGRKCACGQTYMVLIS
jgi:hypothetical protein